jgi:hypothetical protein
MMTLLHLSRDASRFFGRSALLVAVLCLAGVAVPSGQDPDDDRDDYDDYGDREEGACESSTTSPALLLPTTKLIIEHNATNQDTGVHGAFDGLDWAELCVLAPDGRKILEVGPQGRLEDLTMSGIFFESREPPNDEFPIAELMAWFPEGLYSIRGETLDGQRMKGAATFTHAIPAAPGVIYPQDGAVVASSGLVVMWEPVTTTLTGAPLTATGYEIIITKLVPDDPHGFSRPTFDVHVPPSQTMLTVPSEFLEPGSQYELEVLALERSGNQTITLSFFEAQ